MVGTVVGQEYLKKPTACKNCKAEPCAILTDENVQGCLALIYAREHKAEAVDVPAVQEKRLIRLKGETYTDAQDIWTAQKDMYESFWSCADKKRVLLTSVDGSIHVCHKVNTGE